jgi:hypothetical protein
MTRTPDTLVSVHSITPRVLYQAAVIQGRLSRESGDHNIDKIVKQAEEVGERMEEKDKARHIWQR